MILDDTTISIESDCSLKGIENASLQNSISLSVWCVCICVCVVWRGRGNGDYVSLPKLKCNKIFKMYKIFKCVVMFLLGLPWAQW